MRVVFGGPVLELLGDDHVLVVAARDKVEVAPEPHAPGPARASLLRCLLRVGTLAEPRLREDPAPRAQALLHQRSRDGHVDAVGQPERAHAPREKAGGAVVHEHGTRRAGQRDRLGGDVRQR